MAEAMPLREAFSTCSAGGSLTGYFADTLTNLSQCRINPAEFAICLIHRSRIFGLDGLGDLDRRGARSFYSWPCVDADAGQQRCAKRATLFGCQQLYGTAVYVGLDLPPQRPAGAAAAEADTFDGNPKLRE